MGDESGTEGLAEWYELAIVEDDEPEAKAPLMWEWAVIVLFTAVFWSAIGLLVWAAWSAGARWLP
jgi:hypothetical protein